MGYIFDENPELDMDDAGRNGTICQIFLQDVYGSKITGYKLTTSKNTDDLGKTWEILTLELDNGLELIFDCEPLSEYMHVDVDYNRAG